MTDKQDKPNTTIPAATVVIFRKGPSGQPPELLMVQRAKNMRFAGGAAVFPGGRIDPEDIVLATQIASGADQQLASAQIAAIRETLEETGLVIGVHRAVSAQEAAEARSMLLDEGALEPVLQHFGWQINLAGVIPFAHWCPHWNGAFDTRFFLADLGTGAVDISVDATENSRLFWISAASALKLADAGEIYVIFPTRRNLERLAQFDSFADAAEHARTTPVSCITPWREQRDGQTYLTIPEGLGYPTTFEDWRTAMRGESA